MLWTTLRSYNLTEESKWDMYKPNLAGLNK